MAKLATYLWPGKTQFGYGAVQATGREVRETFQAEKAFLLTDPGIVGAGLLEPVKASLESSQLAYEIYQEIPGNPDIASVDAAGLAFHASEADLIVAVGGGSVIDAAKGVRILAHGLAEIAGSEKLSIVEYALRLGDKARPTPVRHEMPPMIAIPTTAGTGAEVTPWSVLTDLEQKLKFSIGGPNLVPDLALIDPALTLTLPPWLTAATGLDALSHCIEAYVSTNNNPALDPMILNGIELLGRSLRLATAQPDHRPARYDVMLGSMIGGIAISSNWLGACHSLAHQISSFAGVHHGVAIALMLPHQMAFSLPGAVERYGRIGAALEEPAPPLARRARASHAVTAVGDLIADIGLPARLNEVGVTEDIISDMAWNAYHLDVNWQSNPRLTRQSDLEQMYRQAY